MLILLHERVAQYCTRRDIASLQSFIPATCRTKFNKHVARTKSWCMNWDKSMDSHQGTCRCHMSLGDIPETFYCVCGYCDFVQATCPCYTSLLNIPRVCTSQDFVTATCRCNMSPRVQPPLEGRRGRVGGSEIRKFPACWSISKRHFRV